MKTFRTCTRALLIFMAGSISADAAEQQGAELAEVRNSLQGIVDAIENNQPESFRAKCVAPGETLQPYLDEVVRGLIADYQLRSAASVAYGENSGVVLQRLAFLSPFDAELRYVLRNPAEFALSQQGDVVLLRARVPAGQAVLPEAIPFRLEEGTIKVDTMAALHLRASVSADELDSRIRERRELTRLLQSCTAEVQKGRLRTVSELRRSLTEGYEEISAAETLSRRQRRSAASTRRATQPSSQPASGL